MYHVAAQTFTSGEALARLYSKEYGYIPPSEFIPIAERKGMIKKVSEQVLETVCRFISESGIAHCPEFSYIALNLSVVECVDQTLPQKVFAALDKYKIDPSKIMLEITETTATLSENLPAIMQTLTERGVRFAMDDFGTGYANFDSVIRLPFSEIKLDKVLLDACSRDVRSKTVLSRIVKLSKELGLITVVEGVETKDQSEFVSSVGADLIQGYYYAKPLPIKDAVSLVCSKKK